MTNLTTSIGQRSDINCKSKCYPGQSQTPTNQVVMPDLFVSFASQKPRMNPFYECIKFESEAWISGICGFSDREQERQRRGDLAYFGAVAYADAEPEDLRTMCDFGHWFIAFDDAFDEGHLSKDPEMAKIEVESLLATMDSLDPDEEYPSSPLLEVFHSIWLRVAASSSQGCQQRFIQAMAHYCSGLLDQVDSQKSSATSDVESYLDMRRKVTSVYPLLALNEYVHALDIPDIVFENRWLQQIEEVTTDIILLQNDVVSSHREQELGVSTNLLSIYCSEGLSQQAAYDQMGALLRARYRTWYVAQSELPQWGEEIDTQVQTYIRACQDVILANLNWSFRTERYFGKQKDVVRKSRVVTTLL